MASEIFLGEATNYWRISGGIQEDLWQYEEQLLLPRSDVRGLMSGFRSVPLTLIPWVKAPFTCPW